MPLWVWTTSEAAVLVAASLISDKTLRVQGSTVFLNKSTLVIIILRTVSLISAILINKLAQGTPTLSQFHKGYHSDLDHVLVFIYGTPFQFHKVCHSDIVPCACVYIWQKF